MDVIQRFLKYVSINTQSCEASGTHPSFAGEFELANRLKDELTALGVDKVRVSDQCYVFAELSATPGCEKAPALGFIAHMDTSCAASGTGVKPRIVSYEGKDIELRPDVILSSKVFPSLNRQVGKELIVTDGTTLLGADDKAGVAEIMTTLEQIITDKLPHGKICVGFTPDEEIGEGTLFFDVADFGADYAYTLDGASPACIQYSNFNAAVAEIVVHGLQIHPGAAKNIMKNAQSIGFEFNAMLPSAEVPECTEKREGFYHLYECGGNVMDFRLNYMLRDHDVAKLEIKKQKCQEITAALNLKYGEGTVECHIRDQYRNMEEIIQSQCFFLVDIAKDAVAAEGFEPMTPPIRGGTDGAKLTHKGLPCPNLGTGGYNFHGVYEYASIDDMKAMIRILLRIINVFSKRIR